MGLQRNPTWLPVVALALSDGHGRWLMHRRPEGKAHADLWEFPGGKVEPVEIPVEALVREAREELGIVLDPPDLRPVAFADDSARSGSPGIVILLYSAVRWQGEPAALEGGAVGWFDIPEMQRLPKPPLDCDLLHHLASINPR